MTNDIDQDILFGFIEESMDSLTIADQSLILLESNPRDMDLVNAVFRAVHSLKGNAAFFDLMRVKRLAHKMEDLLDGIRQDKFHVSKALIDVILPGTDMLRAMLESIRAGGPECDDEAFFNRILANVEDFSPEDEEGLFLERVTTALLTLRDAISPELRKQIDDLLELIDGKMVGHPIETPTAAKEPSKTRAGAEQEAAPKPGKTDKTMRISEHSLDDFLDHVGELLGIEEMLTHMLRKKGEGISENDLFNELKQTVQQFAKLSATLRNGIMEIRKVSPRVLFGKIPRMVREIANTSGKSVSVICEGEELLIDKSYAELLDAPLVHMIRNAVDHGVEMPDERSDKGKPPEGRILVRLREEAQDIILEVTDDGRGLNEKALTEKARDIGLCAPNEELSEDAIIQLLFMSGVSTAREITEISGRGVGMDVVKQSIEQAGGRIRVSSRKDKGCTFTIFLPKNVSTRIVDGYLVRGRSGTVYVLPLKSVIEAFAREESQISSIRKKGRVVMRRGDVYPLLDLEDIIFQGHVRKKSDVFAGTLVLIQLTKSSVAVSIEDVVGVQKIVIKPIDGITVNQNIFEGAALLGDGKVALVIGEKGLMTLFDQRKIDNSRPDEHKQTMNETAASPA